MIVVDDMLKIAAECVRHPKRHAVWSPERHQYVCPETEEGQRVSLDAQSRAHPPLNSQFKLVFVTASAGTLLFVVLCIVLTLVAGKEPPPLFEKVVMSIFDMAKIGFGAIVGLLGAKRLDG